MVRFSHMKSIYVNVYMPDLTVEMNAVNSKQKTHTFTNKKQEKKQKNILLSVCLWKT